MDAQESSPQEPETLRRPRNETVLFGVLATAGPLALAVFFAIAFNAIDRVQPAEGLARGMLIAALAGAVAFLSLLAWIAWRTNRLVGLAVGAAIGLLLAFMWRAMFLHYTAPECTGLIVEHCSLDHEYGRKFVLLTGFLILVMVLAAIIFRRGGRWRHIVAGGASALFASFLLAAIVLLVRLDSAARQAAASNSAPVESPGLGWLLTLVAVGLPLLWRRRSP